MSLRFDANLTWLFTEVPFERRFDEAAAAGFAAVEYASPYDHDLEMQRRRLDDAGLSLILINSPRAITCVPGSEAAFRSDLERALDAADTLGARFIHMMGGAVPPGVGVDACEATYMTNMAWAASRAEGSGVRLVIEVLNKRDWPGMILRDQAHASDVVRAVDSAALGLLLDVFHAELDEGDAVKVFERFGEDAFHLQVADSPRRSTPGTGTVAWREPSEG